MVGAQSARHRAEPGEAPGAVAALWAASDLQAVCPLGADGFGGLKLLGAEGAQQGIQPCCGLGGVKGRGRGQNAACPPRHLSAAIPMPANMFVTA